MNLLTLIVDNFAWFSPRLGVKRTMKVSIALSVKMVLRSEGSLKSEMLSQARTSKYVSEQY